LTIEDCYVDAFGSDRNDWQKIGVSPYLHNTTVDYVRSALVADQDIGDFSFPDTAVVITDTINHVYLELETNRSATSFDLIDVYLFDGASWYFMDSIDPPYGVWEWYEIDVSARLNTIAKINAAEVYLYTALSQVKLLCRKLIRRVDYTAPTAGQQLFTLINEYDY
jgi:hypothetical protein